MEKNDCGACGTPKRVNHFGKLDCPHCYPENFFCFTTVKSEVKIKNSGDIIDNPIFQGQGIETLAEPEEA